MAEALGPSLDELPPQTRRFLELLDRAIEQLTKSQGIDREGVLFRRRDARGWTGSSYWQVRTHLERLVELEYVLVHRSSRGYVYELLWDGEGHDGESFVLGLLEGTTQGVRGEEGVFEPPLSPGLPPIEGRLWGW